MVAAVEQTSTAVVMREIVGGGHYDHWTPKSAQRRDSLDKRRHCSLSSQKGRKERWPAFTMLEARLGTSAHHTRLAHVLLRLRWLHITPLSVEGTLARKLEEQMVVALESHGRMGI